VGTDGIASAGAEKRRASAASDGRHRPINEGALVKITRITTEEYRWPRHKPISNGKHTYTHAGLDLVKIETDAGITGIGLGGGGRVGRATIETLTPLLIGEDPIDVERLWHKMWVPKLIGRRGLTTRAISAIDIGLWDIRAKVAGLPLYKLLGGYRDRVPTYIAGGYYEEGKGLRELAQEMIDNVEMGARAIKMKVGAVPIREDVERVKVVREAIGPDVKLLVDANCAYRYYEAIQLAKRIEEYDIFWFEEPVAPDDYEGHRKLAEATTIPIATGENEYTRYGFRDLIAHNAAAILNADAKILGGVTEFMKVAALAQAHDLDIAPHGSQDIHVHLVAAISNGLILEYYRDTVDPLWAKMYHTTLRLNDDGTVSPPDVPGIGVDPNYEVLAPYRIA
jgi:D-arabinonate dehydratase